MKKETLIAIILGISLGAGVAVVMIAKSREVTLKNTKTIGAKITPTPKIPLNANSLQTFEVQEPENGVIVATKNIVIKARVNKNSLVVVQSPTREYVFQPEKDEFSLNLPLAFGENVIRITVYPNDTQPRTQEKELRVYYLDEL